MEQICNVIAAVPKFLFLKAIITAAIRHVITMFAEGVAQILHKI